MPRRPGLERFDPDWAGDRSGIADTLDQPGRRDPDMDRDDQKARVRDASDIVQIVGDHLTLKAKGREYVGLCPFHDDHNPSMAVVPSKQIFHCFVCGAGGDVFTFVQRYLGVSFPDALKHLADRAGIELVQTDSRKGRSAGGAPDDGSSGQYSVSRSDVVMTNRRAVEFFKAILRHQDHGQAARDLIERRGISPEMVDLFQVGTSPDRWDGLVMYAQKQGISEEQLLGAGLVKRRDNGGIYDALRNRLIFPICNEAGEPVAFGGRRIDDQDEPKYLNSPETVVFRKSATMYGLHLARPAIRDTDTAIVVEGYTDVIACHQAGVRNVVATLGTAFTSEHARKLRGLCQRVVLLFDGDEAGLRAADRAFEVLFSARIDVLVATLGGVTDAKDPDELFKRPDGQELFQKAVDGATHLIDQWATRLQSKIWKAGPASRGRLIEEELRRLADLGLASMRPVDRRIILERAAGAMGVPYAELNRSLPKGRATPSTSGSDDPERVVIRADQPLRTADWVLACMVGDPRLAQTRPDVLAELRELVSTGSGGNLAIVEAIEFAAEEDPTSGAVLMQLSETSEQAKARAVFLLREVEQSCGDDQAALVKLFEDSVGSIRTARTLQDATGPGGPGGSSFADRFAQIKAAHQGGGIIPTANPFSRTRTES